MKFKNLLKTSALITGGVALLATAGGAINTNASHVHHVSQRYLISRCAHVPAQRCHHWEISPKNPRSNEVNIPNKVRQGLTMMHYRIYGQKNNKVKLEDPRAAAGADRYVDNYVTGRYDLTSKPGYRHYGVLITDRAGTHYLAKHHVKFRFLKDTSDKDDNWYDLLESYSPHLVGWVNDNGAYSMDLPTANGPYTVRQFKQYRRYYRIIHRHALHRIAHRRFARRRVKRLLARR